MARETDSRIWLAWALGLGILLLAWVTTMRGQDPVEPPTELEPIIVTAPIPPLDRSQHLLRLLIEKSAPCLGCDAAAARDDRAGQVLNYLLASRPPEVDEATRLAYEIKLQDSPDLQYLRR